MLLLLLRNAPYVPADPVTAMHSALDDVRYLTAVDEELLFTEVGE